MHVLVLVCQSSSKVVLDVGVHDRSEVVETAVPEQVNDEHLNAHKLMVIFSANRNSNSSRRI